MADDCHQTFIQISDLHFGDMDERGNPVYDWSLRLLWKWLPALRGGLSGHEFNALVHLQEFYTRRLAKDPNLCLLLTGDLTATGKQEQFQSVVQYVDGRLSPARGSVGLGMGAWLSACMKGERDQALHQAIPGNHDHWPGRYWLVGPPKSLLCAWSRHLPFVQQALMPLRGTRVRLRFLAINTDADVGPWGPERVFARGSFLTQVRRLATRLRELGPPHQDEIRVLLLHHSLAYRARQVRLFDRWPRRPRWLNRVLNRLAPPFSGRELEINTASASALRQLLAEFQISVILTGHTHNPLLHVARAFCPKPPFPGEQKRVHRFLEACCGTTTQAMNPPTDLDAPAEESANDPDERPGSLDGNSLLIHRLLPEHGHILWHSEIWYRDHQHGFIPADRLLGARWQVQFPVWPRS